MINMNQSHPFYEKYRRAQAGLPPVKHEVKPRVKREENPQSTETGLGPDWAKKPAASSVNGTVSTRARSRIRDKKYKDIKDKIRAEWTPTPRYPTYDDYLADKNRRNFAGMSDDQRAQWGTSTHAWE